MGGENTTPSPGSDARLQALAEYDVLGTPPEETYDALVMAAAKCFGVERAAVGFLGSEGQWLKAWIGPMKQLSPPQDSFCAYAINKDEMLVVADALHDPRFSSYPAVVGPAKLRFYAGAPIRTPAGVAIGTVCVVGGAARPGGATSDEAALLVVLADKAAAQLELRRLNRVQTQLSDCSDHRTTSDEAERAVDPSLTPRQVEVLTWAAQGKSAAETATILGVSTRTVRFHLAGACERLGVARVAKAIAVALGRGLIVSPSDTPR